MSSQGNQGFKPGPSTVSREVENRGVYSPDELQIYNITLSLSIILSLF